MMEAKGLKFKDADVMENILGHDMYRHTARRGEVVKRVGAVGGASGSGQGGGRSRDQSRSRINTGVVKLDT